MVDQVDALQVDEMKIAEQRVIQECAPFGLVKDFKVLRLNEARETDSLGGRAPCWRLSLNIVRFSVTDTRKPISSEASLRLSSHDASTQHIAVRIIP